MRRERRAAVAAALVAACLAGHGRARGQERDPAAELTTVRVVGEPCPVPLTVRGGVPLPAELDVRDPPSELTLARRDDAGRLVPVDVQWRTLARWGGPPDDATHPVRWALATCAARVGDELVLVRGAHTPAGRPLARETDAAVLVDTGRLRFTVPRDRFAPLSDLVCGASAAPVSGLDVTLRLDDARVLRLSARAPELVALEENGPLRAVVRIEGRCTDAGGAPLLRGFCGYVLRLSATRDSATLGIEFTLVNTAASAGYDVDGPARGALQLRALELRALAALPSDASVHTLDAETSWALRDGVRLLQRHVQRADDDESRNFEFELTRGGDVLLRGARTLGALGVRSGGGGVAVAVGDPWQAWPRGLAADGAGLVIELLPDGEGPYVVDAGRRVGAAAALTFAPEPDAATLRVAVAHAAPPAGLHVDPRWSDRTGALGPGLLVAPPLGNASLERAAARLDQLGAAIVCGGGADALTDLRERRGAAVPGTAALDLYGSRDLGDVPDGGGYAALRDDLLLGVARLYLRSGDAAALRELHTLTRHRVDADQDRTRERTGADWRTRNGFARTPGARHGRASDIAGGATDEHGDPGATHVRGLVVAWLLTGDADALAAAQESADAFAAWLAVAQPEELAPEAAARAVDTLTALHDVTQERAQLDAARVCFERRLLAREERCGARGSFAEPVEEGEPTDTLLAVLPALVRYHDATGDARALALVLRVLRRLEGAGYARTGRVLDDERYLPLQLPTHIAPDGAPAADTDWSIASGLVVADVFAAAAEATGERSYAARARELLRDSVLFLDAPPATALAPREHVHVGWSRPLDAARRNAWLLTAHARTLAVVRAAGDAPQRLAADAFCARFPAEAAAPPVPPAVDVADPAPAAPDAPPPPPPPVRAEALASVELDDRAARFVGPWTVVHEPSALGGSQHVAAADAPPCVAVYASTPHARGRYRIAVHWGRAPGASSAALVEVRSAGGVTALRVDQADVAGRWRLLGEFDVEPRSPVTVSISNAGARGVVLADGVRLEPVAPDAD